MGIRINITSNILLSVLSGILLALAFPKFSLFWLAWIALVPFFIALRRAKDIKEALLCGFCFGIVFFTIDIFWIISLFRFAGWWILFGWLGLIILQILFILLFVVLVRWGANPKRISYAVEVALIWAVIEWLRAWGPFGFTGGDVGYSQVHLLPLIQIASLVSVYGVSFLVVLINAAITNVASDLRIGRRILVVSLVLVVSCYIYGIWEMQNSALHIPHPALKLALIQPNIDQEDKMEVKQIVPTFDIHEELTRKAMKEKPDIIVWPETAIFSFLLDDPPLFKRIKKLAEESGAWLVIGTPYYDRESGKTYNSIVSVNPAGEVISRYDKEQLVPFGEYLPFRNILYPILKGVGYYDEEFNSNPHPVPLVVGENKIAAAVCFESTFPDLIRKRVKSNSDFILMVTNDAWFGTSSAPYFHLETAVFRAIENRRYFVQEANSGISALIDPYGRILKQTELNERDVLILEIPLP